VLNETTLTLAESPDRALAVSADPRASARARAVRVGWLGRGGRA
jgi:hypothetical protein